MKPSRPYLLNAMIEWIVDSGCTPHILVDADQEGVTVPLAHVKDGQIVLNIAPSAVQGFHLDDAGVSFAARFGGVPFSIYVPMVAVLGIYARENGQGMVFEPEDFSPDPIDADTETNASEPAGHKNKADDKKPSRPSLKVVK